MYNAGIEAVATMLLREYSETKFRDGAERDGFNLAIKVAQGMAPPKPPLKFGDKIETVAHGAWVNAVFIKIDGGCLFAVDEGSEDVERYPLSDEGNTWRRKL